MSERKVLNKYYPPDFDPAKIPKLHLPKNRQYTIRIMAPFNMRCNLCGEYIYKGKKFNSRKETVEDEDYLGLHIFRFYIKCPRCVAEIAFKTDPQNTDYELEAGATRNFEAMRTAEMLAKQEMAKIEEEEKNNPMKVLENRTKASQREMEMLETLEDLKELNSRNANLDLETMTKRYQAYEEQLKKLQDEEDEKLVQSIFGKGEGNISVKRLQDDDDEAEASPSQPKMQKLDKPTDFLTKDSDVSEKPKTESWQKSVGSLGSKKAGLGLAAKKSALGIVAKKAAFGIATKSSTKNGTESSSQSKEQSTESDNPKEDKVVATLSDQAAKDNGKGDASGAVVSKELNTDAGTTSTAPKANGALGLLGNYSDSGSGSEDSD